PFVTVAPERTRPGCGWSRRARDSGQDMANRHRRTDGSVSNPRYRGTENRLQYRRGGERPTAAQRPGSQGKLHRQREAGSRVRPGLLQLYLDEVAPLTRATRSVGRFVSTFVKDWITNSIRFAVDTHRHIEDIPFRTV